MYKVLANLFLSEGVILTNSWNVCFNVDCNKSYMVGDPLNGNRYHKGTY